jgi:hypothetical protein
MQHATPVCVLSRGVDFHLLVTPSTRRTRGRLPTSRTKLTGYHPQASGFNITAANSVEIIRDIYIIKCFGMFPFKVQLFQGCNSEAESINTKSVVQHVIRCQVLLAAYYKADTNYCCCRATCMSGHIVDFTTHTSTVCIKQWFPNFFLAPPLKYKKYFAHHKLFYINHRRRYRGHFLVLL